jgi:ABC-2 type transport system permease protein
LNRAAFTQVGAVARRSMMRTLRQPAMIIPAIGFPLMLLAVNSGGLNAATRIPGFPTSSYLTFALAIPFMQGALFAAMSTGTNVATDIETGFLSRLSLTPLRRSWLLIGQLSGALALGLVQAVTFLSVGLIAGAGLKAGVGGAAVILVLSVLITLGFGAIGAAMALRTGSGEAVQGLFPLLFVTLFLSSMALPRNLIEIGWFRTVATWNPVSYLLEGVRSLLIEGWDAHALIAGFGCALAIAALALTASSAALRTRVARS